MTRIHIYTDGGSRGNPGPSALGVYMTDDKGEVIAKIGKKLGITTNNVAEYSAILAALTYVLENKEKLEPERINFFMDSQLAYSQLVGLYKIKNDGIRQLMFEIRKKEAELHTDHQLNEDQAVYEKLKIDLVSSLQKTITDKEKIIELMQIQLDQRGKINTIV